MGTSYHAIPLSEIISGEEDTASLKALGLQPPEHTAQSRYPTPREILAAISEMTGCDVAFATPFNDLEIFVTCADRIAIIWVTGYAIERNDDAPQEFYFYRGDRTLVVEIMERLSRFCGPFLLADYDEIVVVQPGTTPDAAWVSPR